MTRTSKVSVAAMVIAVISYFAMNYKECPVWIQGILVGVHFLAAAAGFGAGIRLMWRKQWLGLIPLGVCGFFLWLQAAWIYQCCR